MTARMFNKKVSNLWHLNHTDFKKQKDTYVQREDMNIIVDFFDKKDPRNETRQLADRVWLLENARKNQKQNLSVYRYNDEEALNQFNGLSRDQRPLVLHYMKEALSEQIIAKKGSLMNLFLEIAADIEAKKNINPNQQKGLNND